MSITSATSSNFITTMTPLAPANDAGEMANAENKKTDQKPTTEVPSSNNSASTYTTTIYGTPTAPAPGTGYTKEEREQHIDAYANRVKTLIGDIESDREGKRNIKFQNARQFMEPAGYFSGGLLAAGHDPHEQFKVKFSTYTGMGKPDVLTGTEIRTYFAWEIAAGALEHDKVQRGGPINFQSMSIEKKSRGKINELESLGHKLQDHWEKDIATPMRDASGEVAQRSGKADAYVTRGTLQSLFNNKDSFEKLSGEAKEAIKRTLEHNGQVIIPNIYGYPLSGYAFIPYTPYDGNYENRPNQGLMIDLRNGAAHEIKGDDDFANWAKNNQNTLHTRFNASDRQGGKDAHWPKAGDVLDTLIRGKNATYPGYQNLFKDQAIPVRETFNYTRARGDHYQLKFGNLDNGIASKYQEQNATNAVWADQTEVFGSSQQNWKAAKDFWGNTFGYVPVVGNAGNIVFGIHDGIYGKTAEDRIGGSSGAVISALQLAHELATAGGAGTEEPPAAALAPDLRDVSWRYNSPSSDFELVRAPKAPPASEEVPTITEESQPGTSRGTYPANTDVSQPLPRSPSLIPMAQYAVADGEELIRNATRNASGVYRMTDSKGVFRQFVRVTDETGTHKVFEISGSYRSGNSFAKIIDPNTGKGVMVVTPGRDGEWTRAPGDGGAWWNRASPSTADVELTRPRQLSDEFLDVDGKKMKGAEILDKYLKTDGYDYTYGVTLNEEGKIAPQISWTFEENPADATPPPPANVSTFGTSEYSSQFIDDLHRDKFTIEGPGNAKLELDIGSQIIELQQKKGALLSNEELRQLKQKSIEEIEKIIPEPELRARISELANQWALGPAAGEFATPRFKGTVLGSGRNTHYHIKYDPADAVTTVTAKIDFIASKLSEDRLDLEPVTDIKVNASRTFTIRESNELDGAGYTVDPSTPTRMEIKPTPDE